MMYLITPVGIIFLLIFVIVIIAVLYLIKKSNKK